MSYFGVNGIRAIRFHSLLLSHVVMKAPDPILVVVRRLITGKQSIVNICVDLVR